MEFKNLDTHESYNLVLITLKVNNKKHIAFEFYSTNATHSLSYNSLFDDILYVYGKPTPSIKLSDYIMFLRDRRTFFNCKGDSISCYFVNRNCLPIISKHLPKEFYIFIRVPPVVIKPVATGCSINQCLLCAINACKQGKCHQCRLAINTSV